jgi:hypothetical protein
MPGLFNLVQFTDALAPSSDTMAVENNVYLAKLAEQAERYEGNISHTITLHHQALM